MFENVSAAGLNSVVIDSLAKWVSFKIGPLYNV